MFQRAFIASTLAGVLCWLTGCSREDRLPPSADAETQAPPSAPLEEDSFLPRQGGVSGYVGSSNCKACHEDQYASWHRTYHRTMTQLPTPDAVQADFNNVVLTNAGVRFTLSRKGDEFRVRMESETPGTPERPAPEPVEVPLGLVTGSHHMQVFWVANGMGNCQVGFPFTWLIPERRWVPRNSTFIRPPTVEHRPETWNHVCSRCHATAPQPNLDRATLTWHTQVEELGISCEACHGPGERHVAQAREWERTEGRGVGDEGRVGDRRSTIGPRPSTNWSIVHPKEISPERASQICGFCHSMKWWAHSEGWPERGFSYRPGDDLEATTPIIRPKELDRQPWLRAALEKNPDILEDFFWSDGMIRVSGREYNGLIESPCYQGGRFSCLSCHSMHSSEPNDMLARNRADNQACTQCHERFRDEAELTAHTRHRAASSGSECYNCHMPHTTYGVLSAIRSHQVSSPAVADQLATGRPNACTLCHLDKPLAWTAGHLANWYRHPLPSLTADQTDVADAVLLALAGDAGQRALTAWHLSWEPAAEASGKSWIAPILGQLLDDPYAAVRCVAERSLRKLDAPVPAGYDYTVAPDSRPAAGEHVLAHWSGQTATHARERQPSFTGDLAETREEIKRLVRERDDTPVRLRE